MPGNLLLHGSLSAAVLDAGGAVIGLSFALYDEMDVTNDYSGEDEEVEDDDR